MPDAAVELQDVWKTYRMRRGGASFEALKGVSLRVGRGERLGIVGRNGAGKTTLLKLLTGNFAPTRGRVAVNGAVQALMQVGLGFYPAFSGQENARSALLYNGLSGASLDAALADVVDFCELGDFLHQPLNTYSLGMRMRLQFATATAIRPEILIVDEIMGAGDAYFSAKSAERMKRLTGDGCTLLLVSHSPYQVLEFCDRALWLDRGAVRMTGAARDVLDTYQVYLEQLTASEFRDLTGSDLRTVLDDGRAVFRWPGKRGLKVSRLRLLEDRRETLELRTGGSATLELEIIAERDATFSCSYMVTFRSAAGRRIARVESDPDSFALQTGGRRNVAVDLSPLLLNGGDYSLSVSIYDREDRRQSGAETRYDVLSSCLDVKVHGSPTPPYYQHPAAWTFAQ